MTRREQQLLELAKLIINKSGYKDKIALTGSLMLSLRGIDKRREAHDVDLVVCLHTVNLHDLYVPDGFVPIAKNNYPIVKMVNALDAEGTTVDILLSDEFEEELLVNYPMEVIDGILCANPYFLIDAKEKFAILDKDPESRNKHLEDVQYLREKLNYFMVENYDNKKEANADNLFGLG